MDNHPKYAPDSHEPVPIWVVYVVVFGVCAAVLAAVGVSL